MKRIFTFSIVLAMMVSISLPVMAAKETYTISELYDQYNGYHWQGDYETARKETVHVDVVLSVPQADTIGIYEATKHPPVEGYRVDESGMKGLEIIGEENFANATAWFSCGWPSEELRRQMEKDAKKKGLGYDNAEEQGYTLYINQFDMETCYAMNNIMTVQDAWDRINEGILRFFPGEDIEVSPSKVHAVDKAGKFKFNPKTKWDDILVKEAPDHPCHLSVQFNQLIHGVPIIMDTEYKEEPYISCSLSSLIQLGVDEYRYGLHYRLYVPGKAIKKDVRLADPMIVLQWAEDKIQAGLLRSVRTVRLGYELAHVSKKKLELRPVWVIQGDLFKKAKEEPIFPTSGEGIEFANIVFDAQTGKMLKAYYPAVY